jgi:hypothetical protein
MILHLKHVRNVLKHSSFYVLYEKHINNGSIHFLYDFYLKLEFILFF